MTGIAYDSTIVIYNSTGGGYGNPRVWYGTEQGKVRVELTQGENIQQSGLAEAAVCRFKVYDKDLAKPYQPEAVWRSLTDKTEAVTFGADTIIVLTKKGDLNVDITVPTGEVLDADYEGGLFQYLTETFGYTFRVATSDHYSLIPHWVIGGR